MSQRTVIEINHDWLHDIGTYQRHGKTWQEVLCSSLGVGDRAV